jgi:hypothetical protein
MVIAAPAVPNEGVKLVIATPGATVNDAELVAVVPVTVTEIIPVEAAAGTAKVSCAGVDEMTVAAVPFRETAFSARRR